MPTSAILTPDAVSAGPSRTRAADDHLAPRVAVLGATPGTGNLGVDALGAALVQGLLEVLPRTAVTMQAWNDQPVDVVYGERTVRCNPLTIWRRSKWRRHDGVAHLRRLARLAGSARRTWRTALLGARSRAWPQIAACDAAIDVSAGDSFADIYGPEVFWYQSQIKRLILDAGVPLILAPQTYGPFVDAASRREAAEILRRARLVATREFGGLDELRELAGREVSDAAQLTPDVALLLDPAPLPLPPCIADQTAQRTGPLIALNVSGLLYHARRSFELADDYAEGCLAVVEWALSLPRSRVLLVPHVIRPAGVEGEKAPGSVTDDATDGAACHDLLARLPAELRGRVTLLEGATSAAQAKYAISQCDFFIGARMHAFLGAASLHTPGVLLAYSKKAAGTAGSLGLENAVVDLRQVRNRRMVDEVRRAFNRRQALAERLGEHMPRCKRRIREHFARFVAPIVRAQARRRAAPLASAILTSDWHPSAL